MKKFKFNKKLIVAPLIFSLVLSLAGPFSASAATTVSLGTADSFSVLAGSSIVDTNPSTIVSGDVGLSPGTSFGALTSAEVAGTIYAVDGSGPDGALGNNPSLVGGAKTALTTAFTAAGQVTTGVISADLGGQTLTPGVYEDNDAPDSLGLTGTLTLNAQGNADAVFIFKTGSTLTTAASSSVVLINGAQACNVFWQIGSSATFGTNSIFKGNVMADIAITDNGGSIIEGRLLASTGAVTLNNTTLTKATCVAPPPAPSPAPAGGGGGYAAPVGAPPLISVEKIPTPLALPAGPGLVTYAYTVTNIGTVPIHKVKFSDNRCTNALFISGDSNGDALLDVTETWKYSCAMVLKETTTNTVTVAGTANGFNTADTANATVVVGLPLVPPLIHLVKKPNIFLLPFGGGPVTYTYTVTNPGTEPLNNVSVIDDKCTGLPGRVVGHPGDLNNNNLLESNEVWSFVCQTYLTANTTNTGTAEGHANGLSVIDFAVATVLVAPPALPNTGLPPEENSGTRNALLAFGVLAASLILFSVIRKKQIA